MFYDTIAASATPPLTGAIAIIRVSGSEAFSIVNKIFFPSRGCPFTEIPARYAAFGELRDPQGKLLDKCLAIRFPAPFSYTGEDCAELQIHGGLRLVSDVLSLVCSSGARLAGPGEFTRRAFLNGKMDLTGAEAVADLINAESSEAIRNAAGQLSGRLRSVLDDATDSLLDIASHFSAYIDYTEEGVEPPDLTGTSDELKKISASLLSLSNSFSSGRNFSEGVKCAIIGKPNAGKSSLLNALIGQDRSIVTSVPGTTRDTVEAVLNINGAILRLIDTAGLRTASDEAEKIGVERSRDAAATSSLLLAVFDGSRPLDSEDRETESLAEKAVNCIRVYCKSDLGTAVPVPDGAVCVSSVNGTGLEELKAKISELLGTGSVTPDGSIVTNRRQSEALSRAAEAADRAAATLSSGLTPDLAWVEVNEALSCLGEVTGRNVSDEVLDRVFERFCVGK